MQKEAFECSYWYLDFQREVTIRAKQCQFQPNDCTFMCWIWNADLEKVRSSVAILQKWKAFEAYLLKKSLKCIKCPLKSKNELN